MIPITMVLGYCSLEHKFYNPCVLLNSTVRNFGTAARTIGGVKFEGTAPPEFRPADFVIIYNTLVQRERQYKYRDKSRKQTDKDKKI